MPDSELIPPLLEVRHLVKEYRHLKAVNDISFSLAEGMCCGLLGPNGAGKTTTIEILEGILKPTQGEVLYQGEPRDANFWEDVGIQFQKTALLSFLSVQETLIFFQQLYRNPADLETIVQLCRLQEVLSQPNDKLSGGQLQRLHLALALINQPRLLFLDEPSAGLDPHSRQELWGIIDTLKTEGKTILLTTHYMEEAQALCDEVIIMDQGRIIAQGSPTELINRYCQGIRITLPDKYLNSIFEHFSGAVRLVGNRIEVKAASLNRLLAHLLKAGVDLSAMNINTPNLEEVFLTLTGRKLGAEAIVPIAQSTA